MCACVHVCMHVCVCVCVRACVCACACVCVTSWIDLVLPPSSPPLPLPPLSFSQSFSVYLQKFTHTYWSHARTEAVNQDEGEREGPQGQEAARVHGVGQRHARFDDALAVSYRRQQRLQPELACPSVGLDVDDGNF